MTCTHCQAEIPNDSLFCPSCGQKAAAAAEADVKKCAQCLEPLDQDAKFCESCGAPVQKAEPTCPGCQEKVSAGAVFCNNCGYRLTGQVKLNPAAQAGSGQATWQAPPPVQQTAWQAPPPPPPQASYQPYGQAQANYGAYQPADTGKPPKKKKGWMVAVIIVAVLVLAGTATALLAGQQIKRRLMGPKASYLAIEAQALKQQADDLVTILAKLSDAANRDPQGGADLQFRMNLEADMLGMDPVIEAIIDNLTIHTTFIYDHSGQDKRSFTAIDLLTQNERLLTLEALIESDRIIVGLPEILNQYVVASFTDLGDLMYMDIGMEIDSSLAVFSQLLEMDLDVDDSALQNTLYKVIDIILEHMDSVEFEQKQTLRVGSVSAEYDCYTVTLSSENARLMVLEILELLRDDREVFNLVNSIVTLGSSVDPYGYTTSITFREYQDGIDEAIEDLESAADEEVFTLIQKVYVDGDEQVVGRDIQVYDEFEDLTSQIQLFHPVSGDQEAWLFSFSDDYQDMRLTAQYTVRDDKKTGTASLTVDRETVLNVSFTDFYIKTIGADDYPLGDISVSIDAGIDMPDRLTFSGWEEAGRFWMALGIPDYGSLEIGYRRLEGSEARIPNIDESNLISLSDPYALEELFTEDTMTKLMEIMEKLGLSDYMYDMYE